MFTGLRLNRLSKPMASMLTAFKHRPVLSQLQIMRYFGSIIHVKLPDLGEGTKEATLKEWFVEKGSEINEYQDI